MESFETTPLSELDTTGLVVSRGPFCDAIDDRQVDAALGAVPDALDVVENGDTIDVAGTGTEDVVHEFGCSYTVAGRHVARAWVFAPPVDATQAQRLVEQAGKGPGCEAGSGPPFGAPTLALTCTKDGVVRASYRGLFGDAWLVCEVGSRMPPPPTSSTWPAGGASACCRRRKAVRTGDLLTLP